MTPSEVEPAGRRRLEWWVAGALVVAFVLLNGALSRAEGRAVGRRHEPLLGGARDLLDGRPLGGYTWAYWGYMAVVAFWQETGAGLPGVVGFQIGVAAVAGAAVAALGATLGGLLAGLVGAAFLLINPEVVRWHAYILTDSLYISAVVIAMFVVWRAAERGGRWYGLALLVLLPAATCGRRVPPAAGRGGLLGRAGRRDPRLDGVALGVIGPSGRCCSPSLRASKTRPRSFPAHVAERPRHLQEPAFRMEMPRDETPAQRRLAGRPALRPTSSRADAHAGARRIVVELAHVRPFYSARHNVLIVAVLVPLYALALTGVAATWRHPLTHLLLGLIAAHLLFVAVTLADYDGRFLLHILGPLAVLAAAGFGSLIKGTRGLTDAAAPSVARLS